MLVMYLSIWIPTNEMKREHKKSAERAENIIANGRAGGAGWWYRWTVTYWRPLSNLFLGKQLTANLPRQRWCRRYFVQRQPGTWSRRHLICFWLSCLINYLTLAVDCYRLCNYCHRKNVLFPSSEHQLHDNCEKQKNVAAVLNSRENFKDCRSRQHDKNRNKRELEFSRKTCSHPNNSTMRSVKSDNIYPPKQKPRVSLMAITVWLHVSFYV